jgi:hypothetical protein
MEGDWSGRSAPIQDSCSNSPTYISTLEGQPIFALDALLDVLLDPLIDARRSLHHQDHG